jgi:hypothetical protein
MDETEKSDTELDIIDSLEYSPNVRVATCARILKPILVYNRGSKRNFITPSPVSQSQGCQLDNSDT